MVWPDRPPEKPPEPEQLEFNISWIIPLMMIVGIIGWTVEEER